MRILIVTDAWYPQVNGVVRTLSTTITILRSRGHVVEMLEPSLFHSIPMPGYHEIRLALTTKSKVKRHITEFAPDVIHIATEGPLGFWARLCCSANNWNFTTAYHTQFPEYLRLRLPIPLALPYKFLNWFHSGAVRTMVATDSMRELLHSRGFKNLVHWSRGVNLELFKPDANRVKIKQEPILVYVGRVAVEKNIEDFLTLDVKGEKHIVGDGPELQDLKSRYPQAVFHGFHSGQNLVDRVAAADVMVFPSRTDTFGLVLIEAMACGVPVAAYPVPGPVDLIINGSNGWIDEDLCVAVKNALRVKAESCRQFAEGFSWDYSVDQFLSNITPSNFSGESAAEEDVEAA